MNLLTTRPGSTGLAARIHSGLAVAVVLCTLSLSDSTRAGTPSSGTIAPGNPVLTYTVTMTGQNPTPDPVAGGGVKCNSGANPCDSFKLRLELPNNFKSTNPNDFIRITASWAAGASDWDIWLYQGDVGDLTGGEAAYRSGATSANPEIITFPAGENTQGFTIKTVPFSQAGETVTVKVELVAGPPPPDPAGPEVCWTEEEPTLGKEVLSDPDNDNTGGASSNQQYDIRSLHVAEANRAEGGTDLIFSLKVDTLATLPAGSNRWIVNFKGSDFADYWVAMTKFADTDTPIFEYGPGAAPGCFAATGPAGFASAYNADGTITLAVDGNKVAMPKPGLTMNGLKATAQTLNGTSALCGVGQTIDSTSSIAYRRALTGVCPTPPPPPGRAKLGGPLFATYSPPPALIGLSADEPTMDINLNTNNAFMIYSLNTLRTQFDDTTAPACAVWDDVTNGSEAPNTADPILSGDQFLMDDGKPSPRIYVAQLQAANSLIAFTDDEGENWTISQGGGQPHGADNESLAAGPWPTGLKPVLPGTYDHAVYYCSHEVVNAFCSRSDTGGLTWNPSRAIFPATAGCNNHGHVKVGPDGTVYVPINNPCQGAEGVSVSIDAGDTWHYLKVPNTAEGRWDSSIAIANDGKTIYYGYGEIGDDRAMIIKGTLKKIIDVTQPTGLRPEIEWDPAGAADVSSPAGLKNIVFPTVVAGDPNRAAIAFHGTTREGDSGLPADMGTATGNTDPADDAVWHLYVAVTYDGGATWELRNVTPDDPTQKGAVCDHGTTCSTETRPADRNLLDFMDMVLDRDGRIVIGYADGCTGSCATGGGANYQDDGAISRQVGGRPLFGTDPVRPGPPPKAPCLSGSRTQLAATLTWGTTDDNGSPITHYEVWRGTEPGAETLLGNSTLPNSYVDTTADPTVAIYYYKIKAVNALGKSAFSNEVALEVTTVAIESPCDLPGITVVTDPAGDQKTNGQATAAPTSDIQAVHFAEPFDLDGNVVVTIKVANLTAVPAGYRWVVYIKTPNNPNFYAAMTTNESPTPRFVYGSWDLQPAPGTTGLRIFNEEGTLHEDSGYTANGFIQLVIPLSVIGSPGPGVELTDINAAARTSAPNNSEAPGSGLTEDATGGTPSYTLVGNASCAPDLENELPVANVLVTPVTGAAPLKVTFNASSSTDADGTVEKYVFDFGDGSPDETVTTPVVEHTYQNAGQYGAKIRVIDNDAGVSDAFAAQIVVGEGIGNGNTSGMFDENTRIGGATSPAMLMFLGLVALFRRRR